MNFLIKMNTGEVIVTIPYTSHYNTISYSNYLVEIA